MSNYVRGILTTAFDQMGLVQNIEISPEADEDTAKNKSGVTKYFDVFDARVNLTATVRFDRDSTQLPEAGDVVELSSMIDTQFDGHYKVTAPPGGTESNETGPTVTIPLRRYINGEIPVTES